MDFGLPSVEGCLHNDSCLPTQLAAASFCIDGTPIGALVTKSPRCLCSERPRNLFLYHCLPAGPSYIGIIKLPDNDDELQIHSTAIAGRQKAWDISVEVGNRVEYYHIESSKAYSMNEPAYQLTPLQSGPMSQKGISVNDDFQGSVVRTTAGSEETEWVLLGALPRIDVSESSNQLSFGD